MGRRAAIRSGRLSRSWILWLYATGALVAAEKGNPMHNDQGALPVGSVGSLDDVHKFQVAFCKLSREDNRTYFLPWPAPPDGTLGDDDRYGRERQKALSAAGDLIDEWWQLKCDGVKGRALWAPFMKYRRAINDPLLAMAEAAWAHG